MRQLFPIKYYISYLGKFLWEVLEANGWFTFLHSPLFSQVAAARGRGGHIPTQWHACTRSLFMTSEPTEIWVWGGREEFIIVDLYYLTLMIKVEWLHCYDSLGEDIGWGVFLGFPPTLLYESLMSTHFLTLLTAVGLRTPRESNTRIHGPRLAFKCSLLL